jgi:methyl-galactoside transport system substrate-binding protein
VKIRFQKTITIKEENLMKKLGKLIALVMMIVLVAGLGMACRSEEPATTAPAGVEEGGGEQAERDLPVIGMTVYSYANVFTSYIRGGIHNYVEANNLAEILTADGDNDPVRQLEQIEAYIAMGVDGLIVMPVDIGTVPTIIDMARAADTPVVFVNRAPDAHSLLAWEDAIYVGLPLITSGEMQAEIVVENWLNGNIRDRNGNGVLNYVTLMGDLGHPDAEARVLGNQKVFDASGIEHYEMDRQIANWDTTRARDIAEIWLGRWPNDLDVIISNNDAMALGVIEAVNSLGLDIPVVGINAIPEVHDMILRGEYFGTVLSDPWKQAMATIDLLLNRIDGRGWFDGNDWEKYYCPETRKVRIEDVMITAETVHYAQYAFGNCLR